jgi:hypothetical protein
VEPQQVEDAPTYPASRNPLGGAAVPVYRFGAYVNERGQGGELVGGREPAAVEQGQELLQEDQRAVGPG